MSGVSEAEGGDDAGSGNGDVVARGGASCSVGETAGVDAGPIEEEDAVAGGGAAVTPGWGTSKTSPCTHHRSHQEQVDRGR